MKPSLLSIAVASALFPPGIMAQTDTDNTELPSMLVSADFRPAAAQDIPVSLTTFDEGIIESRGAQHIEDVLNLAPNVNLSSGASRGQFFRSGGSGNVVNFWHLLIHQLAFILMVSILAAVAEQRHYLILRKWKFYVGLKVPYMVPMH